MGAASQRYAGKTGTSDLADLIALIQECAVPGGAAAHPDLAAHDALGLATDVELAAHVSASDPHVLYALDADLANHEADTTAIHGITNTAALVVTTDSRLSDARTPTSHAHVDADLPAGIARDTEVTSAVAAHAATPHGSLPAGLIVMWGGLVASIPSGWLLCDGANGTPDLRDRFVKGASGNPGTTGGAATHGHTVTQPTAHPALSHSGTAVADHTVTQPAAHAAHVVTQPAAHVVTQPATHAAHAALGTHAHELPFSKATGGTGALKMLAQSIFGSGTSRAPESISAAPTANTVAATVALSQAVSAGTPDAHSAHTGTAVDAHSGTAVDAHSGHTGTAVSAHSVTQPSQHAAQSHSGAAVDTVNSEPAYFALCFIQKT